jgi:hypothetical protein
MTTFFRSWCGSWAKLRLEQLKDLAKSTPIFAPGVEPLFAIGAVTETWVADQPFAPRLAALLRQPAATSDLRDQIGRGSSRESRVDSSGAWNWHGARTANEGVITERD